MAGTPVQPGYGYPPQQSYVQPEPEQTYIQPQPYDQQAAPQYPPAAPNDQGAYGYAPVEPTYTPQASMYQPPDSPYPGYPEYAPTEPPKKKGASKLLKFGVPIAAVVAVAVVAVILIFASSSPMATASKALTGMISEASERLDNTPLKALGMIFETLADGKLTVSFDYEDTWYDEEYSGNVRIFANKESQDYAIEADLSIQGMPIDAALYINKDRLAIGSRLVDNNYYGFKYSTFRDDVRGFGRVVGLDDETMDELSDVVDTLNKMMNAEADDAETLAPYMNLMTEFSKSIEMFSENAEVESGGANVKCKKIWFVVTDEQVVKLLNDFYDILEDDDNIREQYNSMFDSSMFDGMSTGMSYRDMLKTLRDAITSIERDFSGEFTYSLFVGNRDRLLRFEMEADAKISRDKVQVRMIFDFGTSAQDKWTCSITASSGGDRETIKLVWDYKERSGSIENSLIISPPDAEPITLKSVWSPDNGRYTLSYLSSYESYWDDEIIELSGEITGIFTWDDKNFRLTINNPIPEDEDAILTIEIKGEPNAQIKEIDYIGIDQWGLNLLERLQEVIYELS